MSCSGSSDHLPWKQQDWWRRSAGAPLSCWRWKFWHFISLKICRTSWRRRGWQIGDRTCRLTACSGWHGDCVTHHLHCDDLFSFSAAVLQSDMAAERVVKTEDAEKLAKVMHGSAWVIVLATAERLYSSNVFSVSGIWSALYGDQREDGSQCGPGFSRYSKVSLKAPVINIYE